MILEDKRTRSLATDENPEFPAETRGIPIFLPLPPRPLWPNARPHWAVKSRATKSYRTRAKVEAILAMHAAKIGRVPRWPRASVTITYFYPDNRQRPDRDNALAALKAAFDGLADAQVVCDDADFIYQPIKFGETLKTGPFVHLLIEPC